MKITPNISRKERRWIHKLKHKKNYVYFLSFLFFFFPQSKKFISLPVKWFQKVFGIVSVSVFRVFWLKLWLLDDFVVHKKLRGRWFAQKLFSRAEKELENQWVDYMILTSGESRKASHKFYKKAGMAILGFGIGIVAYKKIRKK